MARNWNLHTAKRYTADCSVCRESISAGHYYRNGSEYRHSACHANPAAHAPVTVAAPASPEAAVTVSPFLARALAEHARAGRLPTYGGPEPLSDYEREYEDECR